VSTTKRRRRARARRLLGLGLLLTALTTSAADGSFDTLVGEVEAIDPATRRVTVRADAGGTIRVDVPEGTALLRAKPGATTLSDAIALPLEQLTVGDRVLARGAYSADHLELAAQRLVVMSHDDIAQRQDAERADWRERGVVGSVTAVDAAAGTITLRTGRAFNPGAAVVATAGRSVAFRRYAAGSRRFHDAQPSAFDRVAVGDELRALGNRDAAGALLAEQVVFGSFRMLTGELLAVAPANDHLIVRDEASDKKVMVALSSDTPLRRLLDRAAFAGRRAAGEDLIDRLPAITAAELRAGDRILVATTKEGDPASVVALAIVSGLPQASAAGSSRSMAAPDAGLPPDVMDLGMGLP
jgi:hypothetical protein